ncbi:hypothetical protein HRbin40_01677 [bacterium HR40]|nr:hypothetical protein HRbin40_01677 [bacterium HR40]
MSLFILTANRLRDGRVVFLTAHGWEESLRTAIVAATEAEQRALEALGAQSVAMCEVVDPYLVEVEVENGVPSPLHYRERIRASGPTVRPDLARRDGIPEDCRVSL